MSREAAVIPEETPHLQISARDSLNLIEFPLSVLSDRAPTDVKVLEFQDEIRNPKTGEMVTRRLVIDGSQQFGLPTATDDEVLLGLIQVTKLRSNFSERKVHFSRYELMQLLGWPNSGQSYRRIEYALDRWMRVTLDYQRGWWDSERQSWVDVKFHILDQVHLYESERKGKGGGTQSHSWFEWNEVVFDSFTNNRLKQLNLQEYLRLKLPIAKRMYRFLDKRFYFGNTIEFDLHNFALEHIGLSRKYHTGKIKEKLAGGIRELEAAGYLQPMTTSERYRSVRRGEWKIAFVKQVPKVSAQEMKKESKKEVVRTREPKQIASPLAERLIARGVTAKVAHELVKNHPADRIARQVDVLDWMLDTGGKELKNPGGWLAAAIEADFTPPKVYVPKTEREEAAKRVEETKRKQAEAKSKEREQFVYEQRKREHVRAFLAELENDPQAKKAFEERATTNASEDTQKLIRSGGTFSTFALHTAMVEEVFRASPLSEPT